MAQRYAFSVPNAPVPANFYGVESNVLEGSKAWFGYKNSEGFDWLPSPRYCPTVWANIASQSALRTRPVKLKMPPADKNYWKCNLAFICASYCREGVGDSISRWNTFSWIFADDAKLLCPHDLRKLSSQVEGPMKESATDARIVSVPALQYTGRERISCHFNREGAYLCLQILCVN